MDLRNITIRSTFYHSLSSNEVEALPMALISLDEYGKITKITKRIDENYQSIIEEATKSGRFVDFPRNHCFLPGFVDLHLHAPQYPQLGVALDAPLEDWLNQYTFPLEAKFANLAFAADKYSLLVDDLLGNGTTTAVMFGTVHLEATKVLADLAISKGLRAFIGKVIMDNPENCPEYYRDATAQTAVEETVSFINYVRNHPGNELQRVQPVITPRFIPSCTDETLRNLGNLARETKIHVQTHCSESDWEHNKVLKRFGVSDTQALDSFGLLTPKTILAHSIFINDIDMQKISERGTGIAHCPLSNVYFGNAVFPLRAAMEKGILVGLGTDISGGPSASMFDSMRTAVVVSKMLEFGSNPNLPLNARGSKNSEIDWKVSLYLATLGGSRVLGTRTGNFVVGNYFDAIQIDTAKREGTIRIGDLTSVPSHEVALSRIVYTASKPNIAAVFINGHTVAI